MKYPLISVAALTFLSACDLTEEANVLPTVTVDNAAGFEASVIDIVANAEDSDGEIVEYNWRQVSGSQAELNANGQALALTLPSLLDSETLTFELTVTDSDDGVASTEFDVTVEPITEKLILAGSVRLNEARGDNFRVWSEVGEQKFTTTANELGYYNLELNVDDSLVDKAIHLFASFDNDNSIVKLSSVIPSLNELKAEAGELVDTLEEPNIQITPFTTAAASLVLRDHGSLPASYAEYQSQYEQIKLQELVDLAIANSMIIKALTYEDYQEEVIQALPANFKNLTVSFADEETSNAIIDAYKIVEYGYSWNNATEALISNSTAEITEADVRSALYFDDKLLQFNSDGTGKWIGVDTASFNWELNQGVVTLTFDEGAMPYRRGFTRRNNESITELKLTALINHYGSVFLNLEPTYKDTDYGNSGTGDTYQQVAKTTDGLTPPLEAITMDTNYLLSYETNDAQTFETFVESSYIGLGLKRAVFNLNEGSENAGTVALTLNQVAEDKDVVIANQTVNWSISNNILSLTHDNEIVNIAFIDLEEGSHTLSVTVSDASDDETAPSWTTSFMQPTPVAKPLTAREISGKRFMFEPRDAGDGSTHYSWYEFNADGTMAYIYANDARGDKVIEENNYDEYYGVSAGLWKIEDGKLVILRHRRNSIHGRNYTCLGGSWTPTLDDYCVASTKRIWQAFESDKIEKMPIEKLGINYEDASLKDAGFGDEAPFAISGVWDHFYEYAITDTRPVKLPDDAFEQAAMSLIPATKATQNIKQQTK